MVFKKSDKIKSGVGEKPSWYWWIFPITGLLASLWYLIRVVPKPSRASYPCQRAAAPLAGGFLLWLIGLVSSITLFRKARDFFRQSRLRKAAIYLVLFLAVGIAVLINLQEKPVSASLSTANSPVGIAKGIYPGRVVWAYDPNATDWEGYHSTEHWWQNNHTDQHVVDKMMSQVIRGISGKTTDAAAWDAIFRYNNQNRGNGDVGYKPGEKIAIKLNMVTCNTRVNSVDPETYNKNQDVLNNVDTSPQMVLALLRQLVNIVGAAQADITVGDPTALFPNQYLDLLYPEFPNVHYWDNSGGAGRTRAEFSDVPFYWSTRDAQGKVQDYLPQAVAQASYLVNFAVLKGHSVGVTLCAKNHYGTLIRCPDGLLRDQGILDYYNTHMSLPYAGWSLGLGKYRSLVDLLGHRQIGGKTVLYLIDGLYGGYYWDAKPVKWKISPFGNGVYGDWPSSLFGSQDPVAIDSVAYDFLLAEWPDVVLTGGGASLQGGAEDYLHEAAQADNPPSGTFYDPDRSGTGMTSLGVHEHWNNATEKLYSRNLGTGDGIELFGVYNPTGNPSKIAVSRARLNFAYISGGTHPDPQNVGIVNAAAGDSSWIVAENISWLSCSPTSGHNDGIVTVSVNPVGMAAGSHSAVITVANLNSFDTPLTIDVSLSIYTPGSDAAPFGNFETPLHNSTVYSSIPVTGWVLDDVGVESVKIYCQSGNDFLYIGDALLVEGARPDVEVSYPTYPLNYKAGWGYMLLTNFLPGNGNGTFVLHAIAADCSGHQVTLGTKTIICDNANAAKPFGAIDTPSSGGIAAGNSFKNWGWVLTPQPNSIPADGSTITVWVDSLPMGNPVYNIYRSDIDALFPGYANSKGAAGYYYLDTTTYTNGVHTIFWTAADSAGNIDGIGSRFFTIRNLGGSMVREKCSEANAGRAIKSFDQTFSKGGWHPQPKRPPAGPPEAIFLQRGYSTENGLEILYPDKKGRITIEIPELERIVIYLDDLEILRDAGECKIRPYTPDIKNTSSHQYRGYLVNGNDLKLLPIGSTFDGERGVFYWLPAPGFLGEYRLLFITREKDGSLTRKNLSIKIVPKFKD